ncbi:MAG: ABC transporter substrate-binding protein [Acetobacterales bacterium]
MHSKSLLAAVAIAMALATPTRAADKMTLLLDWFINPDHGPIYVALERGYFEDANLDVEIIAPADPSAPPKLVAAGKAELAVSYQAQLHLQVAAGLPIARVGTLVATPLNTLVTLRDGPVKTLADLKGRKVGYSVAGTEEALLGTMLKTVGLTLDDIELVNVNFSISPSLLSGKVDAVIGAYRNFELNQMDIEGHPGRAFYIEEHGVPPIDQLIYVTHRNLVGDDRLRRFIDATERGVQYLVNHPDESWELFKKGRREVDNELNRRAWYDTIPRFALRPGAVDRERYRRFGQFLIDAGLIEKLPPLDEYALELPPGK